MARANRMFLAAGVIVSVLSTQLSATLFASEQTTDAISIEQPHAQKAPFHFTFDNAAVTAAPSFKPLSPEFTASAGQWYRGRSHRRHHDGSVAAMIIGSAAVIAGSAVLVYANRPECSNSPVPGGCGYGAKVIGTSVLAGGAVGLFVGALTW